MAAFLPSSSPAEFVDLGQKPFQFLAHQPAGAVHDLRVARFKEASYRVEGFGHVLDAEVGNPQKRRAELLLHHLGQVHGGP